MHLHKKVAKWLLTAVIPMVTVFCYAPFSFASDSSDKTLIVTNSNNWPPMSFLDDDNEPQGILIDLWKEIAARENIDIEFRLADWNPTLEMMTTGEAHVHAGLMYSEKREAFLDFTIPLEIPNATRLIVSRELNIANMREIGEIPVCVVKGAYVVDYIRQNYEAVQMIFRENSKACVQAAINGEVMAFTLDYSAAMYFLHKAGKPDHFYVADTLYSERLRSAVAQGNTELQLRLNKALKNLPQDEYTRIIHKWLQVEPTIPGWIYPTLFSAAIVLFGGFALFYIFALKRQVAKRTLELERLSQTDSLTKLFNRPKIEELFSQELERFRRDASPFSLIVIDIDHFKSINDTYGHAAGDDVLVTFADQLKKHARNADYLGRWGGEEFLIICPQTQQEDAIQMAEHLRLTIEKFPGHDQIRYTASFGVTEVRPDDESKDVFIRADKALYQAKKSGRNRVVLYTEEFYTEELTPC